MLHIFELGNVVSSIITQFNNEQGGGGGGVPVVYGRGCIAIYPRVPTTLGRSKYTSGVYCIKVCVIYVSKQTYKPRYCFIVDVIML